MNLAIQPFSHRLFQVNPRFGQKKPAKTVRESRKHTLQVVLPEHCTDTGTLKLGFALKTIDALAGSAARHHEGGINSGKLVTASIDRLTFFRPVQAFHMLIGSAQLVKTWAHSMAVRVTLGTRDPYSKKTIPVAEGDLIFVPVEKANQTGSTSFQARPVTPLTLTYETERKRAAFVQKIKDQRVKEKEEGIRLIKTRIQDNEAYKEHLYKTKPTDANFNGTVFGGVILEMMAEAAKKSAESQAQGPAHLVQLDRMQFRKPADIGEYLISKATVTRTWNTSMEVRVDVEAKKDLQPTSRGRYVAGGYFVFTGVNKTGGEKRIIPPFTPETPRQKIRWKEADIRRQARLDERLAAI